MTSELFWRVHDIMSLQITCNFPWHIVPSHIRTMWIIGGTGRHVRHCARSLGVQNFTSLTNLAIDQYSLQFAGIPKTGRGILEQSHASVVRYIPITWESC